MLDGLSIEYFKCFEKMSLPLFPLTLLTGVNGGGKSSTIQSLVLLSQTMREREWGDVLLLNGKDLNLGYASDILNPGSAEGKLSIGVTKGDRKAMVMPLRSIQFNGEDLSVAKPLRYLLPADREINEITASFKTLSWISAERTGPREFFPLFDVNDHKVVGAKGELATGLIYWREDEAVRSSLCLPNVPPLLYHQVRARMQEFFPGFDFRVVPIEGVNAISIRLKLSARSEFLRPQNVGFGLMQVFPIVVAILAAKKGDTILIENPEVHLHPAGQLKMGEFIAKAASSGIQLIVESHSDHILNGIRMAVKGAKIPPEKVKCYYFSPKNTEGPSRPAESSIDINGRLDNWPEGFFDQIDYAMSELL